MITSNELDTLFVTETLLIGNGRDNVILADLLPPNYNILHNPRNNGRGGGVALIHQEDLAAKLCTSKQYDSFEHIITKIVSASVTYHVITLY